MPNSSKGNLGFFQYAQFFRRYNGVSYGDIFNPLSPTPGDIAPAYLCRNVNSIGAPSVNRTLAEFSGAGFNGSMIGGVQSYGKFDIVIPELDATLIKLAVGANIDATTITNWRMFGYNNNRGDLPQVGAIFAHRFQSRETGTDGDELWANLVYPAGNLEPVPPQGNNSGGTNPMGHTFRFAPTVVGKHPNGVAFGANQAWADNKTEAYWIITEKPLALITVVHDGTETSFTMPYLPSFNGTGTTYNWFTRAGVTSTPTSISTSTGVLVLATAATSGVLEHVWMMTDFTAP